MNKSSVERNDLRIRQLELLLVSREKVLVHCKIVLNVPSIYHHILEPLLAIDLELSLSSVVEQKVESFVLPK